MARRSTTDGQPVSLAFLGAASTVTGSCFLVTTGQGRLLVDCGLFQGTKTIRELNYKDFPFAPGAIDALLLTHAHIDHSGLVPKLVRKGFKGPIIATEPTADLLAFMLPDSGYIQESEVDRLNRRNRQRGRPLVEPIYTRRDAEATLELIRTAPYDEWLEPMPGTRARFWNAGHILGSASIELEIDQPAGRPLRLLFSGDIGPDEKAFHDVPEGPSDLDDLVVVVPAPTLSNYHYAIVNEAAGQIKNETGKVVLAAGDSFAQALSGINNQAYATGDYNVEQKGEILAAELGIGAAQLIALRAGGATEAETIGLAAKKVELDQSLNVAGNLTVDSDFHINATQSLNSGGDMSLVAHQSSVYLQAQTASEGSLTINAGTDIALIQGAASHDTMNLTAGNRLLAHGDLVSQADMTITAAETWSAADVLANDDLTVQSNVFLLGGDDQTLASAEGSVHIDSRIDKLTNGSVYIAAEKDVRLDGNIYVESGGLSAISREGKIHTGDSDALNIRIDAYSNDIWENAGVDLPFKGGQGESLGKAAIVLQSKEDLIIGADAELIARGSYAAAGDMDVNGAGVDDRPGVNFLAEDAVIGGFDRDQGVPIDVAIYAGSTGGDVIVETGDIHVWQYAVAGNDYPFYYGNATVVFDAYDTVSMPFLAEVVAFERKFGGFRLEVASRLCEWLSDAVDGGKLPYAVNPEVIEAILGEGNYVLRGSGQNNGAAADGERAWVLENQPANPIAPPLPVLELPELKGCPAETQAAAAELGISSDNLQMTIRNALAMNPSIQPCDACAGIITSAAILNDADGIRLAAMNQIFNTLAPADAPFTPEVSASVVTAFAQLGDQDRQYALAAEYIDAFVRYVAILDTQLKAPVGDAVAFTLDKYGDTLMSETANPNIAAYILAQLMTEGI